MVIRTTPILAMLHGGFGRIAACVALSCMSFAIASSAQAADPVSFDSGVAAGTIVVRTGERRLYLVVSPGRALRYRVGVGRAGRQWAGVSSIDGKFILPDWAPPLAIKRDHPGLPDVVPAGSPRNPLGAAALTLSGGEYAIHGTNAPESIGRFVSYGCIRMSNADIVDILACASGNAGCRRPLEYRAPERYRHERLRHAHARGRVYAAAKAGDRPRNWKEVTY